MIRKRVRSAEKEGLQKMAKKELENYRREKEMELQVLEEEYQRCLKELGMGHKGVEEHEKHRMWMEKQRQKTEQDARYMDLICTVDRDSWKIIFVGYDFQAAGRVCS